MGTDPILHYRLIVQQEDRVYEPYGLEVDVDHDGQRIGEVVHCELGADDRLRVVAVLDDDRLASLDAPIYFSPTVELRGDVDRAVSIAREAVLLGVSVTLQTARVAPTPIAMRAGDIRSSVDRYGWPCSWATETPLLERASHGGQPLRIRTAPQAVGRDGPRTSRLDSDRYGPPARSGTPGHTPASSRFAELTEPDKPAEPEDERKPWEPVPWAEIWVHSIKPFDVQIVEVDETGSPTEPPAD
ncbi:MAG: hypothetical protein ACRDNP_16140 [Gaiellaceae bacterium]